MAVIGSGGADFLKAGREETMNGMQQLLKTKALHQQKIEEIEQALGEMGKVLNDLDQLAKIAGIDLNA